MQQTGPTPTEPTMTITLDHRPEEWFTIRDDMFGKKNFKNLVNGSVWIVRGQDYSIDEQCNYYVLQRVDNIKENKNG